jgi:multidrug efflux pump subunit AcrB
MSSRRPAATTTAPIPGPCRTSRRRSDSSPTTPGRRRVQEAVRRQTGGDLAKDLPGYSIGISQPIIDGVNDMIGGAHSPLVIKIYGDDLNELRSIGGQIVDVLYTIQGTSSASIFQEPPIPQMEIKLDREKAARYGVNMTDVQNVIQTGVGQAPVSTVYVGERTYPADGALHARTRATRPSARQPAGEHRERRAGAAVAARRRPRCARARAPSRARTASAISPSASTTATAT